MRLVLRPFSILSLLIVPSVFSSPLFCTNDTSVYEISLNENLEWATVKYKNIPNRHQLSCHNLSTQNPFLQCTGKDAIYTFETEFWYDSDNKSIFVNLYSKHIGDYWARRFDSKIQCSD